MRTSGYVAQDQAVSHITAARVEQPTPDDPHARRLLQCALGAFQKWPEGFVGFSAVVRCQEGDREIAGDVRVFAGGRVEMSLPDLTLRARAETALLAIAQARTPCFFKDGDGRFPISFEPDDGHPLGRRVRVHLGGGAWRAYRIDAKGRVRQQEEAEPGRRATATYDELVRTSPGRVLPTCTRIFDWDVASGTPRDATEIHDAYCCIDHVVLPARRQTIRMHGVVSPVLTLELGHHVLL